MSATTPKTKQLVRSTILMTVVFGVAALSGCIGSSGDHVSTNLAPEAVLTADREERWTNERFIFNASGSADPDGEITRYHFDFGDGSEETVDDADAAANVTHRYTSGGVYVVTLTVTDDGGNLSGKATGTDALIVAVHQREQVPFQVSYAAPSEGVNVSRTNHAFEVAESADAYEAELQLRSMIPLGDSDVTLRVVDPQGDLIYEENLTLTARQNETFEFADDLVGNGTYLLEMVVHSGGASIEGNLRVYYAAATDAKA